MRNCINIRSITLLLPVLLLTTIIRIMVVKPAAAVYDPRALPNNKVGVHVLHPSEIDRAADLVNSSGGDWGYITVPIQPTDRDKQKWVNFMDKAREKHIIPIMRITTIPHGGNWKKGDDYDLVDFANFLNELPWPTHNRYVVIFNETNRASEWGGSVEPETYAQILKNAYTIFKERSPDFFILPAGMDAALPRSTTSMTIGDYLSRMQKFDPSIWSYIDGWTSHSYPNPGFSSSPAKTGLQSITGYREELRLIKKELPVFITETGWDQHSVGSSLAASYFSSALSTWSKESRVVAVTPFLLDSQEGDFVKFSLTGKGGSPTPAYESIKSYPKLLGVPDLAPVLKPSLKKSGNSLSSSNPQFTPSQMLLGLENVFRRFFGFNEKRQIRIADIDMAVEVAKTPSQLSKGLSGRTYLPENAGMLFILPEKKVPSFWMKDMHFPLDMIWLEGGKVVEVSSDVPSPAGGDLPTYSPSVPADMVLEVNAGWAKRNNITQGSRLELK